YPVQSNAQHRRKIGDRSVCLCATLRILKVKLVINCGIDISGSLEYTGDDVEKWQSYRWFFLWLSMDNLLAEEQIMNFVTLLTRLVEACRSHCIGQLDDTMVHNFSDILLSC